jgi:hypothetical protein
LSTQDPDQRILQAKVLVQRLERLSADSIWAHRASGLRATLDKYLARIGSGNDYNPEDLEALIQRGFYTLEKAALEIPTPDDVLGRH